MVIVCTNVDRGARGLWELRVLLLQQSRSRQCQSSDHGLCAARGGSAKVHALGATDLVHVEAEERVVNGGSVALRNCGTRRLVAVFFATAFAALFAAWSRGLVLWWELLWSPITCAGATGTNLCTLGSPDVHSSYRRLQRLLGVLRNLGACTTPARCTTARCTTAC